MSDSSILIVEDEAIIAMNLSAQLKHYGYRVCGTADSAGDALRIFEAERPNLILMDIMLKGEVDGIELAAQLAGRYPVPVIFLSAYSDEATLKRLIETRPYGFIAKPYHMAYLNAIMQIVLKRAAAERHLFFSAKRAQQVASALKLSIVILDEGGSVEFVSESAARHPGLSDALGRVAQLRGFEGEKEGREGSLVLGDDPVEFPVSWIFPVRDVDGNKLGMVVVLAE